MENSKKINEGSNQDYFPKYQIHRPHPNIFKDPRQKNPLDRLFTILRKRKYSLKRVYFCQIDENGDGFINLTELRSALDICGFKMPGYKVRQMIEEYDDKQRSEHKGRLSFEEFEKLCKELKANELGSTFKQVVSKKENLETLGGISEASSEGTTHSVRLEEQLAFSDWINTNLSHDPDLKHLLPIDPEGKTLYEKVKDGILLWYAFILLFLFVDRLLY